LRKLATTRLAHGWVLDIRHLATSVLLRAYLPIARNYKPCQLAAHVKQAGVLWLAAVEEVSRAALPQRHNRAEPGQPHQHRAQPGHGGLVRGEPEAFSMSAFKLDLVARSAITLIRLTAAPAYMITTALRTGAGAGGRWTAGISVAPG
jgi:hypothetical protein